LGPNIEKLELVQKETREKWELKITKVIIINLEIFGENFIIFG
jgi:hypothetical protein